jgi:2-C-methyl-D-erythritol 4-phosphate cytidylyltransferase
LEAKGSRRRRKMGKHSVIVLAGGSGSRMKSSVPKQYLELKGKPVLAYSLLAFENSFIDEIILVCRKGEEAYCRKEYVEKYHLKKVTSVTPGGAERYLSVQEGLKKIEHADYIWIHDGARPFVTEELLERLRSAVEEKKAVVPGVRVKDTIKQTDENGKIIATVPRQNLWNVQTPQVFSGELIREAYRKLTKAGIRDVTDDGMVVEKMMEQKVWIVEGDYDNMKITTPEDMKIGEIIAGD